MEKSHKNSRIITIKPTMHTAPVTDEKDAQVQEWLSGAVQAINVRHESRTKPVPYTGLDVVQERILIPEIIDIERNGEGTFIDFNKRKKEFYNGLIAYPTYTGLVLEIGLSEKNDSTLSPTPSLVSNENLPLNIDHYVKWRALFENDPRVAKSKAQGDSQRIYQFYIIDEIKDTEIEEKQLNLKEEAMRHYLTITNDVKQLRKFIILMEEGTQTLSKEETDITKLKSRLFKLIDERPAFYSSFVDNPDLDTQFLLQQLSNVKIVEQRIGGAYYDENTLKIAESKSDMIKWLKDVNNLEIVTKFKRLFQERSQL